MAALGGAPAGLPDVAVLAQLAGEFFAALPNGSPDLRLPFSPPQPAQPELALGNRAPALAPAAGTPSGAPEAIVDRA
ncbi:cysteine desulfurase-like protein, SufS subfamily, partial [Thauera sp. 27]